MGLANIYFYKGEYAKAEPLFQRALAIREKALGPDHPDVAETLGALARLYEASLPQLIGYMLRINAGSYSFEAANPRHEHEYHLFEQVKVPDGKVLCPGVITHASNIVEHPELICERILRYTNLVGRENVIAAADCGFSSQALYKTEVHRTVVWEKFKAMREGADLASKKLWKN